ncbi:hypothetical protein BRC94_12235 [Halobacteriales archaeon QS_5_70_17]|nr:MAG: hypothetical protein BRC94_12235 [Halobacteriales archaeon QS_5_70_17]
MADPTNVRSLAVTVDDVVTAVQAREEGRTAVLRATPPFHARMRARLHVDRDDADADAIHLDPRDLLDEGTPPFPTPAETEDRLRASDREYTREAHREFHREAVAEWRAAAREHVVDGVTLSTPDGPHAVAIKPLES